MSAGACHAFAAPTSKRTDLGARRNAAASTQSPRNRLDLHNATVSPFCYTVRSKNKAGGPPYKYAGNSSRLIPGTRFAFWGASDTI